MTFGQTMSVNSWAWRNIVYLQGLLRWLNLWLNIQNHDL